MLGVIIMRKNEKDTTSPISKLTISLSLDLTKLWQRLLYVVALWARAMRKIKAMALSFILYRIKIFI